MNGHPDCCSEDPVSAHSQIQGGIVVHMKVLHGHSPNENELFKGMQAMAARLSNDPFMFKYFQSKNVHYNYFIVFEQDWFKLSKNK